MNANCEADRVRTVLSYELLGSDPEPGYDRITRFGANLFKAPICLVSIIGDDIQWFKSWCGLDTCSRSRDLSFCAHTLDVEEPLVVLDVTRDERFKNNELVTGAPGIRYYAGAPIIVDGGIHLGASASSILSLALYSARTRRRSLWSLLPW